MKKQIYAYLGPQGTYTDQAVRAFMADADGETESVECASISEVFDMVDRGRADFGVVPIENALEGSVNATLDAFAFTSDAHILRELVLDIHHNLILAPKASLAAVTSVVSHPQATGQCRRWIHENLPGRAIHAANSTAESVRYAVEDPTVAGIGTQLAADLYGGVVCESHIEDHFGNQTRFVLIGQGIPARTGDDKTSLALFMNKDRPGTLLMILAEFVFAAVNLTKVQSRPTRKALGEYMFFVDLEGHVDDIDVKTALDSLRLKLREVKVLGSYPAAPKQDI